MDKATQMKLNAGIYSQWAPQTGLAPKMGQMENKSTYLFNIATTAVCKSQKWSQKVFDTTK